MSAIAGIWSFDGDPEVARDCARMLAAQEIYGPHHGSQHAEGPIAIGRRLYRTVPEDEWDRQPLRTPGGRHALVADVRLDNREELTAELGLSAQASPLCDAAILFECLLQWGADGIERLSGEFAFAFWNARERQLVLARDFLGMRPLFYHHGKGFLAFASMPKGLRALPQLPRGADEEMVAEFLTLMPETGPRSFFQGIERVEPGHTVTIAAGRLDIRCYWNPRRPGPARLRPDDYVEGLRHHLDQATRARLRGAHGTVGAQLSGGFDSSSVAATAARLLAPSGGQVVAFTAVPRAGYSGPCPTKTIGDEGPLAAATAALHPNMEHVRVYSAHVSPLSGLDRQSALFGRPLVNLCNFTWGSSIYQTAQQRGLTVLLNGQCGNMTLSYTGLECLPEMLGRGRWLALGREVAGLVRNGYLSWRSAFALTFGAYLPRPLWRGLHQAFTTVRPDVLHYTAIRPERLAELDLPSRARERGLDFSYRPWKDGFAMRVWFLGRFDMGYYSKGTLAGWGVDRRDPTSAKRLVEYCLAIPGDQYLTGGVPRALARRAMRDRLPQSVLSESRKGYQGVDWHESLTAARPSLHAELDRLEGCAAAVRVLDLPRMRRLAQEWPAGGWDRGDVIQSYRLALLRGISAGHFLRNAAEGGS